MTIRASFPVPRPSLDLNFARARRLDPRITFTRNSIGTYVDRTGVLRIAAADEPRFDHDPVTKESLGLLIEEQRTNLFLWSEEAASWFALQQSGSTVTNNTVVSPTGETTADTVEITDNGYRYTGYTTSNIAAYTASFYLRADSPQTVGLRITNTTGTESTKTTITVGTTWKRYSVTVSCTVDPVVIRAGLDTRASTGGTGSGATINVWGAQLEVGAFPTSYIPTTNAEVTRNADVASITGDNFSSWYSQSEGTMFAEITGYPITPGQFPRIFEVSDGTSNNLIRIQQYNAPTNNVRASIVNGGVTQMAQDGGAILKGSQGKTALAFANNDCALVVDGGTPSVDTSVTLATNMTQSTIGAATTGISPANSTISRLAFFDRRLPNATLQAITAP